MTIEFTSPGSDVAPAPATRAEQAAAPCCSAAKQSTCCDAGEKSTCCGAGGTGGGCGCQ